MVRLYSRKAVTEEISDLIADGWDCQNASRIAKKKARKKFWQDHPDRELPYYLEGDIVCQST